MGENLYQSLTGILVGVGSAITGIIMIFAPFLLASISPPLAATASVPVAGTALTQNQIIGPILIVGGFLIFLHYSRKRGD